MKKYNGLNDLLVNDRNAYDFYTSLPDYVQSSISQRGHNVCTEEVLRNYADKLLRGDD